MIKRLYVKTMNKLFRKDIWRVFLIHIEHNDKMKKLNVKSVDETDIPGVVNGYCHVWSKIMEDSNVDFKAIPVIMMDHIYYQPVAHFLINDECDYLDGTDDNLELLNSLIKEDKIRYFRFPKDIEDILMESEHPNDRLIQLKLLMEKAYREKASPIRKLIWNLIPIHHRAQFF